MIYMIEHNEMIYMIEHNEMIYMIEHNEMIYMIEHNEKEAAVMTLEILRATVQNSAALTTRSPGFLHSWS
jgi:hypothetical protein